MNQKIEFIESYIKIGNGDYQWNDNHGELIRCKDCKHMEEFELDDDLCWCGIHEFARDEDYFCADGERKE